AALYPLSLHDALPILPPVALVRTACAQAVVLHEARMQQGRFIGRVQCTLPSLFAQVPVDGEGCRGARCNVRAVGHEVARGIVSRSEEHTSELQSRGHL